MSLIISLALVDFMLLALCIQVYYFKKTQELYER